MSKIVKGAKKIVKGVGSAVSGVFKGVKKVFKKVVGSKLGKIVLIAAAVYLGGAALGAWQSPFTSINGAWATQAATGAEVAATGTTTAISGGAPIVEGVPAALGANPYGAAPIVEGVPDVIMSGGVGGAAGAAAGAAAGGSSGGAVGGAAKGGAATGGATGGAAPIVEGVPAVNLESSSGSVLDKLLGGAKKAFVGTAQYAKDNPFASAMMLNAAAGALTPDAMDLQENRWDREDDERRRRLLNMDVSGVDIGHRPAQRSGFLNSNMAGGT